MTGLTLPTPESLAEALSDGRQSERALAIQRGTARLLRSLGLASLSEVTLADGRRADLMALTENGGIWIVEIKSCKEDFLTDGKWRDYLAFCDRLYFAVDAEFPQVLIPEEVGLIVADRYGAEILRERPHERLAGARRKAVTARFARLAALRLQQAIDPE